MAPRFVGAVGPRDWLRPFFRPFFRAVGPARRLSFRSSIGLSILWLVRPSVLFVRRAL